MTKTESCIFLSITVCIFSIVFFIQPAYAQPDKNSDAGYIFYKGNTLYENGSYSEAISEYSKLLEQGVESGNLYYNLGNCYIKTGDPGKAILNYERARRFAPRDSDLKSNYRFAHSLLKLNPSEISAPWYKKASGILFFLTVNELTVLVSVIYICIIFLMIIKLFAPVGKKAFSVLFSFLIIVFVFTAFSLYSRVSVIDREAIVISDSPEVKFEPFESATTHFTLQEGRKIYLIQTKKNWIKIKRPDGKAGWIRSMDIEKI
jgi:tetratricopeptide (TPR) repeat protein